MQQDVQEPLEGQLGKLRNRSDLQKVKRAPSPILFIFFLAAVHLVVQLYLKFIYILLITVKPNEHQILPSAPCYHLNGILIFFFVFTYVKFIHTQFPCTLNTLTSLIKLQHNTTAYCPLFSGLLYSYLKQLQIQNRYQRHHHAIIQS